MNPDDKYPSKMGPSVNLKPLNLPDPSGGGKALEPFTYEHFTQAFRSLEDGMVMYYVDEAVGIYCRLRGISVGHRPASARYYSAEYADAFEAANTAVYIAATKVIGRFDPDKGVFRPYLDTVLESALKDILKADGYGDFFDQTSKKKHRDDEPEKHGRVNVDRFWGAADQEAAGEPDSAVSDRAERVRRHKDDAFETMIRYIDGLSEVKRAAIYASAFGQILRPDLENYGRDYSETLAKMYNTTSLYIRQLATEGKREALAEARRQGFGESSMNEVYMGYLQVRKTEQDMDDMVLQAAEKLSPYQRFMLLRHLAAKVEETDKNSNNGQKHLDMSIWSEIEDRSAGSAIRKEDRKFEDDHNLLEPAEMKLLHDSIALPFSLGRFTSLDDIRQQLDVRIIIAPGIKYHTVPIGLKKAKEYWEKEVERLREVGGPEYEEATRMLEEIIKEICSWEAMPIRGEYIPSDQDPTIKLYPDEMHQECDNRTKRAMNKDLPPLMPRLLVSTLAHEMMHAYFDRPPHTAFPYLAQVEEPMAEFGMLLYLYETEQKDIFNWADHYDVRTRKSCYRYGHPLMVQHLYEAGRPYSYSGKTPTRRDLEMYKVQLF